MFMMIQDYIYVYRNTATKAYKLSPYVHIYREQEIHTLKTRRVAQFASGWAKQKWTFCFSKVFNNTSSVSRLFLWVYLYSIVTKRSGCCRYRTVNIMIDIRILLWCLLQNGGPLARPASTVSSCLLKTTIKMHGHQRSRSQRARHFAAHIQINCLYFACV